MFFPLPAFTSFLFGLLFVLSLIIDASYEQMYAEICVWKDPFAQSAERWMSLFVSNATAIARPLLFCVLEIVLKSELWTPFLCLSPLFRGWRWIFLFCVWIQRLCCLQAQQVKSITSRVIFPAAVSKNLHQWVKSSRSNTLISCFAE